MSTKTPILILASGRGTNFEAVCAAVKEGQIPAEIKGLICDQAGAEVMERAKKQGIKVYDLSSNAGTGREPFGLKVIEIARVEGVQTLVLAGFMRILSASVIEAFRDESGISRIINIHPSLLPAFQGRDSYKKAFEYGCKLTGVSVHFVEAEVDSGPLLAQASFSIENLKSVQEVEAKGLTIEHALYPATLRWVIPKRYLVERREGRICVRAN